MASDTDSPGGDVQSLRDRIEKLEKINAVLVERIEAQNTSHPGPFALFQSNVELQHKVTERTEELNRSLEQIRQMNGELVAAKNRADTANHAKTRFIAQAGHDLLQPVTAALLSLSALEQDSGGAESPRLVRQIERCLETMEVSLLTLLDISRLDSGVVKPEVQPVSLGAVLADLEEDFAPVAQQRGLGLDVLPSSLVVSSDPAMLVRILQNLVGNALKYTREGRVLVGVRRRGDSAAIKVIDTGPGIARENHALIFEEFQRVHAHAPESETGPGLGLGLAIVRRLVDVLDHHLTIESELGRGTCFTLETPVTSFAVPTSPHLERPSAPDDKSWVGEGRTIFVIDNDATVVQAVADLLQHWKSRPVTYTKSGDAAEAVRDWPDGPDMMIVDYHLNEETAVEVGEAFRAAFARPIPILVITADRSDEVASRVRGAGMSLVYKPVQPLELRTKVEATLK